jgi:hypothetical protein
VRQRAFHNHSAGVRRRTSCSCHVLFNLADYGQVAPHAAIAERVEARITHAGSSWAPTPCA